MFNEMYRDGEIRPEYRMIADWLEANGPDALNEKRAEAEALFRRVGITFAVYGEGGDPERLIPFDMVPRVFSSTEWQKIEAGSIQRTRALNAFLTDIYTERAIVKEGIVPADLIDGNEAYEPVMEGFRPPGGIFSHICGVDLVRVDEDTSYVLEDNCRTPSGISYVLENREVMARMFPELFRSGIVRPVDHYGDMLADAMRSVAPPNCDGEPTLAILTPGHFNSAYYEHSFLADLMGVELVEGPDLFVENHRLYMRTTKGPQRIDVLYRRIDDSFLDPQVFRKDSMLGVPGIIDAYKAGGVTIVNAPGSGVADDKAIYIYVPEMIRFYLGEEPILPNVPTWRCGKPDELSHVMENLHELVVKEVHGSGGYGMLIGPKSTEQEIEDYRKRIEADPAGFIAQPTLKLSAAPTLGDEGLVPRHVDLRPFVISGQETKLIPGGLTRVALKEGSLVVNSSQGGGVKDTWVLDR
ncbi:circularly permuted type 2 ATP-grasp protein [Pontivivens ytuae]|uniref:Circularly permuted type 2 ATP-grasp protein n=1 Tax=Pontivivens ytuae TaxID=2789856 RepID=A0A7S9LQU4_9RHOB|nr:circularly permuted type 2 ATP-grasp protein [Pontivivens ytuae]QPH53548.1 circularly permuted type 2 ATP-grasp protein [Pontivivens ytuae]